MKADLTRNTFDALRHFDRVLMQQGRVQLDADWNEQGELLLGALRTLAADIIGPQGGPTLDWGFALTALPPSQAKGDFRIGAGRYYVDGIPCDVDGQVVNLAASPGGNVPANAPTVGVIVDQWTVDGIPFANGQLVEIFDAVQIPNVQPAFQPTVVQITSADQATMTLALQGAPSLANATAPSLRRIVTYLTQPDFPGAPALAQGDALIYLDVWERLITYVEDDDIREVALLGPDTAARSKIVWQVKALAGKRGAQTGNSSACDNFQPSDSGFLALHFGANRGRIKARAKQTTASADPCIISPGARYTGPENQLYRVEIHRPGTAWDGSTAGKSSAATFKWSRENGSVAFPIVSVITGNGTTTAVLATLGRDDRLGIKEGDWVDLQDDDSVLTNQAQPLLQIQAIDRSSRTVTLSGSTAIQGNPARHPLLRRWDQKAGDPADGGLQLASDNAALIVEASGDTWLELEDGVQIQFQPPFGNRPANQYRSGDYWLIPARTATGDVEWPTEAGVDSQGNPIVVQLAKSPDGIGHHYAPLGVVNLNADGNASLSGDCRKRFGPIAS
ncbi:conserved hypothetical protein [Paraburkholderia sacchari]|uniref:DUF6519 domain-containing protein n=1 Tax=Paraburkholderia sacchari TaxID=159450 RepID=UPI0039A61F6C